MTPGRVAAGLAAVDDGFDCLLSAVVAIAEDEVRVGSRLPEWTRGHVLTHLARNADGNGNMVEGAILGEEREQYPGGAKQRADDIEGGAHRKPEALIEDLRTSQEALAGAWRRVPDHAWTRTGIWLATGRQPIEAGISARRRELLVHLVDLHLGVGPSDLPADFLAEQQEWLRKYRKKETWPDAPW